MRRYLRIVAGFLGAVVLGAIGSGVWDLFLKRIILRVADWAATLASAGVASVRNIPYQDAARGSPFDGIFSLMIFIASCLLGMEIAKIAPAPLWKISESATPKEIAKVHRRRKWVLYVVVFGLFYFVTIQIWQTRLTFRIADDFNHNIGALNRLLDPKEVAGLRFSFTHMNSMEDYLKLIARMKESAKTVGIDLPR
jgi:hypothetical protein